MWDQVVFQVLMVSLEKKEKEVREEKKAYLDCKVPEEVEGGMV